MNSGVGPKMRDVFNGNRTFFPGDIGEVCEARSKPPCTSRSRIWTSLILRQASLSRPNAHLERLGSVSSGHGVASLTCWGLSAISLIFLTLESFSSSWLSARGRPVENESALPCCMLPWSSVVVCRRSRRCFSGRFVREVLLDDNHRAPQP